MTPDEYAEQVPEQWIEGVYMPPMRVWTKREAANFRHGGNRPPFRARLVGVTCGHTVELIPVLTLYTADHQQHWQCWLPPGSRPCVPYDVKIDPDPDRTADIAVSVAVEYDPATREVNMWPPLPRHHTPN